jgi:hypothetical protein
MRNIKYVTLIVVLTIIFSCSITKVNKNNMHSKDYVPNKETALRIAEAIWLPIYGDNIYNQKPYIVTLVDSSIWIVKGTLPENMRGGVAYIEIQKSNCKILKVTHGR